METTFKLGDRVMCNGYPGTIIEIPSWTVNMAVVKLPRGEVCVDMSDIEPMPAAEA